MAKRKKAPKTLPEGGRPDFGEVVRTWRAPRDIAATLLADHGWRLVEDMGERVLLEADETAAQSWDAEGEA